MKNDCLDLIKKRYSVRKFSPEELPDEDLEEILSTGIRAPSGGNRQPWRIVVVKDLERQERLAIAAGEQTFLAQAPVLLVVCAVPYESAERYGERGATLYALQDTAALVQNILLASHILGYGTCWIGAFNEDLVSKEIRIPTGMRPVAMIPIGKPATEQKGRTSRRPLREVIFNESF